MIGFGCRETGLLPRDAAGEAWLAGLIAVLCFLACLAGIGATAADRAAHGWAGRLRAEATVQVRPGAGETGESAAARAAETLAGVDGVEEAQALDRRAAEALLKPWLGEQALADLPLPFLVVVRLDADAPASAVTLSRALARAGLDASVDDHALWRGQVERSALALSALALAGFLLVSLAASAAVVYATRAGLQARRREVETLSLMGASDGAIAWLFQRRFALLAALAGAAGALAAAMALSVLAYVGGDDGVTPALPVRWSDLLILSPCPIVAATVALVAARLAAMRALGQRTGTAGRGE